MISPADYPTNDPNRSGVSWAAIFAGAAAAAALSLILVILGSGLGLAATSPWADEGASAKVLGISTIIWLLITQILASGLGGYIAGRLRVKWANLHGDEVYFRDTAHGFLAWAVATLVAGLLVLGTAGNLLGAGVTAASGVAGATAAAGVAGSDRQSRDSMGYFVDGLFRGQGPVAVSDDAANGVAARILTRSLVQGGALSPEDRTYLAQVVAQRTRLTQPEAEARVDQVYAQLQQAKLEAKQAADVATKAAAWTALWTFVALLCGAFFASLAALFGGRQRDRVQWLQGSPADYNVRHTAAPIR